MAREPRARMHGSAPPDPLESAMQSEALERLPQTLAYVRRCAESGTVPSPRELMRRVALDAPEELALAALMQLRRALAEDKSFAQVAAFLGEPLSERIELQVSRLDDDELLAEAARIVERARPGDPS